ncbi:GumC family protein [Pararhodospirillum oryzae]|uniref:Lipopolysaccharide biosynthesis protein n=1 Tax=Pararhodospirillum oryzae TaxID=478448 RepID=A0A512H3W2_9PROT|nr:hypothetical protein [Pararhodospirillum oryzae]GEO80127.1 hypothetical protein ROR02_02580 [Pararhodospirillum oryzae]
MEEINVYQYFAIFRRRLIPYLVTVIVVGVLVGVIASSYSVYKSEAIINVQAPDIPEGMTLPIGMAPQQFAQSLADERIEQIRQKVMASAVLVEIITKFNLYPTLRQTRPMSEVVDLIRSKIGLSFISADVSNPGMLARMRSGQVGAFAFRLSFTYDQPLLAQQVANDIVSRFIDEDMKARRETASQTAEFLATQLAALEQTMSQQEQALADFREQNPTVRPESLPFYQQMVATIGLQIQDVERQLAATEKSRGDLRAQIASVEPYSRVIADGQVLTTPAVQLKALRTKYNSMLGQYGENHPDVQKLRNQIAAIEAEGHGGGGGDNLRALIEDTRTNLAAAEQKYGPNHPDVVALRNELVRYQRQLKAHGSTGSAGLRRDADNPAYLMLISQIEGADAQYDALVKQIESLRGQQAQYMEIVASLPALEKQYEVLTRDSDSSKMRYRELMDKKMAADMSHQMEQGRRSERLEVIDPPALPTQTAPARLKILGLGVLAALMSGFVSVVIFEIADRTLHGSTQIVRLVGQPPLVAIPHIVTSAERARFRRVVALVAVGGIVSATALLIAFDRTIMPLDVVVTVVMRKLGLTALPIADFTHAIIQKIGL